MASQEFPKAPGALVMSASGQFWVEESAKRVSEKLEDAKGGIGTDDGMVEFVGLESTGKPGAEGLTSYVLRLSPMYIIGVRSLSQTGFENAMRAMQPQNPMEVIFGQLFGGRAEPESEGGGAFKARTSCGQRCSRPRRGVLLRPQRREPRSLRGCGQRMSDRRLQLYGFPRTRSC